ncbi:MAG: hypothetical protein V9F03_10315 [Microthrixaceae bacterium]
MPECSVACAGTGSRSTQSTRVLGVRAGQLLGSIGAGSEMAVDAFLVADADLRGGAVVATCDPHDIGRLASLATHVKVADLGS